jgi:hypothetical protein
MTQAKHILEVYEPYSYEGPNPVIVSGDRTIKDPAGNLYYLLNLASPVPFDGNHISQVLVLPRYDEDHIERAQTSSCTVNICRVMPGSCVNGEAHFNFDQVHHWGVGKITPAPP